MIEARRESLRNPAVLRKNSPRRIEVTKQIERLSASDRKEAPVASRAWILGGKRSKAVLREQVLFQQIVNAAVYLSAGSVQTVFKSYKVGKLDE